MPKCASLVQLRPHLIIAEAHTHTHTSGKNDYWLFIVSNQSVWRLFIVMIKGHKNKDASVSMLKTDSLCFIDASLFMMLLLLLSLVHCYLCVLLPNVSICCVKYVFVLQAVEIVIDLLCLCKDFILFCRPRPVCVWCTEDLCKGLL